MITNIIAAGLNESLEYQFDTTLHPSKLFDRTETIAAVDSMLNKSNIKTAQLKQIHYTQMKLFIEAKGWSGGAMVLGKHPVPGRRAYWDKSRARAFCACSRCGWRMFGHFFSVHHFSFFLPPSGRRPNID